MIDSIRNYGHLLQLKFKSLSNIIKNKNITNILYYLIWILIHFTYHYTIILYHYFVETCWRWNRSLVSTWSSIASNYIYNSRIYSKFHHYYYYYYYYRNYDSKKNDNDHPRYCNNTDKQDPNLDKSDATSKNSFSLQNYLVQQDVLKVLDLTSTVSKYPKHIAFSLVKLRHDEKQGFMENNNEQYEENFNLLLKQKLIHQNEVESLCRLICWSWLAHVQVVSVYDYNGYLKRIPTQLQTHLRHEIETTVDIIKKCNPKLGKRYQSLPSIQFHVAGDRTIGTDTTSCNSRGLDPENTDSDSGVDSENSDSVHSENTVHVCLFSRSDGKSTILKTVSKLSKQNSLSPTLSKSKEHSNYNSTLGFDKLGPHGHHYRQSELKEAKINSMLSQNLFPQFPETNPDSSEKSWSLTEPELLLVVGNLKSTMGFLPWNLRLTEINWIPDLFTLGSQDFIDVLQRFSMSQQRFGT